MKLDEITLDVIDEIRAAQLKEATKGTTNRYLALVRSILLRARDEWEWVDKVPKVRLFKEFNSRERSLTPEQAKQLLKALPEHQREMVLFALATGLRQGNIVKLEWPQVNLELCHAWVLGTQSKNRHPISVPLNDAAMGVLRRHQTQRGATSYVIATAKEKGPSLSAKSLVVGGPPESRTRHQRIMSFILDIFTAIYRYSLL